MFKRMLFDLANNRSGFPDLVYFPSQSSLVNNNSNRYEFLEVKGPGDQLQANQKRWIEHFSHNKIPFRLLKVQLNKDTETITSEKKASKPEENQCPN